MHLRVNSVWVPCGEKREEGTKKQEIGDRGRLWFMNTFLQEDGGLEASNLGRPHQDKTQRAGEESVGNASLPCQCNTTVPRGSSSYANIKQPRIEAKFRLVEHWN